MGKAKRLLNAARKEVFNDVKNQYNNELDQEYDHGIYEDDNDVDKKIVDLSYDIREALFDYTNNTSYPLCEYLDIENMINYIKWVLRSN